MKLISRLPKYSYHMRWDLKKWTWNSWSKSRGECWPSTRTGPTRRTTPTAAKWSASGKPTSGTSTRSCPWSCPHTWRTPSACPCPYLLYYIWPMKKACFWKRTLTLQILWFAQKKKTEDSFMVQNVLQGYITGIQTKNSNKNKTAK